VKTPFEALVLSTHEISESDLLVSFLSAARGRFSAVAKGARRSRRRFVNKLESGHLLRVHLRRSRRGLAPIIEAADLLWAPERLRSHPRAFVLMHYFLETCERSSPPAEGREVFPLLKKALEVLEESPDLPPLKSYFEFRLMGLLGWAPEFSLCLGCGRELPGGAFFSFARGGAVCGDCALEGDRRLSARARGLLRSFSRLSFAGLFRLSVPGKVLKEVEEVLEAFLLKVLDQDIKALKVLREFEA